MDVENDVYWKQALGDFEVSHRPKAPKDGLRGSLTHDSRLRKVQFFEEFLREQASVQDARKTCENIQAAAENQYTSQSINFILQNLNYVIAAGDLAFKGGTESFSLAWSGVKFVLFAIQADQANCEKWAAAGASISTILVGCRTLGRLYEMPAGQPSTDVSREVTAKLPVVYLAIIRFSYAAKIQLERHKTRRLFDQYNPFSVASDASQTQLDLLKEAAQEIRDTANVAFQEWSKEASKEALEGQEDIKGEVENFRSLFLEHQQKQNDLLQAMNDAVQETKGMVQQLVQVSGLKSPYDADRQRFFVNKKMLRPQEQYLQNTYAAKRKTHDQRPHTCKWIFKNEKYCRWRESENNGFLWICGGPGYGKSVLVTHVIETLKTTDTVPFFYCSKIGGSESSRSTARIKQDLVWQLYELTLDHPDLLAEANRIFSKPPSGKNSYANSKKLNYSATMELPDMEEAFAFLAGLLKRRVFLIIDALDECADRIDEQFISTMQRWVKSRKMSLKILVSSRREPDLVHELSGEATVRVEEFNSDDIRAHANVELNRVPSLSNHERFQVCDAIVKRAHGQFTYINLAMQLVRKPIVRPITNVISQLAENTRAMNQATLRSTDPSYMNLAKTCLTWTLLRFGSIRVTEIMDIFSGTYDRTEDFPDNVSDASEASDITNDTAATDGLDAESLSTGDEFDLYVDQVRAATGPFLVIKAKPYYYLAENHPSVRESFVMDPKNELDIDEANTDCPKCGKWNHTNKDFLVNPKYEHLRIAIQCLREVNNPAFQRRYFRADPQLNDEYSNSDGPERHQAHGSEAEALNMNHAEMEENASEIDVKKHVERNNGKTNYDRDTNQMPEEISFERASIKDQSGNEHITNSYEETEALKQQNGDNTEPADDDLDSEHEIEQNELLDNGIGRTIVLEDDFDIHYAILYWPYHLREAEILWGLKERIIDPYAPATGEKEWKNPVPAVCSLWRELRDEIRKLFIDHPSVFRGWKDTVSQRLEHLRPRDLTPAHVAAAYGLYSVAVMLQEEGQSLLLPASNAGDSLPLYYLRYSPQMDEDVNLMKLLAQNSEQAKLSSSPLLSAGEGGGVNDCAFLGFFEADANTKFVSAVLEILNQEQDLDQWLHRDKPLHLVAQYGTHVRVIPLLVEKHGAQINSRSALGNTAIHELLGRINLPEDMLKAFLSVPGVDVNAEDDNSERPLVGAARRGHLGAARILVDAGADIHDIDEAGDSAMSVASEAGSTEIVQLLLNHGAAPGIVNNSGVTPLYKACSWGHEETALLLLHALEGQSIDSIDRATFKNRTPLRRACMRGMVQVVEKLLKMGGSSSRVNVKDNKDLQTPIFCAAWSGNLQIVEILLEHDPELKIEDKHGQNVLDICKSRWLTKAEGDFEDIILALLAKDPDLVLLQSKTSHNMPRITHMAAAKGSVKVLNLLINLKFDIGKKDDHGWTPLQVARQLQHHDVVALLEQQGSESGLRPTRMFIVRGSDLVAFTEDGLRFSHNAVGRPFAVTGHHPVPADVHGQFYFEVTMVAGLSDKDSPTVAVGYSTELWSKCQFDWTPGTRNPRFPDVKSWTFLTHLGTVYSATEKGSAVKERSFKKIQAGQTVGCGLNIQQGTIMFSVDGKELGSACNDLFGRLFPIIGVDNKAVVDVNFGQKDFLWKPANSMYIS